MKVSAMMRAARLDGLIRGLIIIRIGASTEQSRAGSAALHLHVKRHSIGHRNLNGRVTCHGAPGCMHAGRLGRALQAMARCEPMARPLPGAGLRGWRWLAGWLVGARFW
jgi:hypothetical protein